MGADKAQAHTQGLTGVCFATIDGAHHLLSCGADGTVCMRSPGRFEEATSKFSIGKALYSIAASKDGSQFMTTDEDQYVKVGRGRMGRFLFRTSRSCPAGGCSVGALVASCLWTGFAGGASVARRTCLAPPEPRCQPTR